MTRLRNGENIVDRAETGEMGPVDYLKRCLVLLNTVREITITDGHSSRVSLLFEKLLKTLSVVSFHDNASVNKDIARCIEALYDLIDWLMLQDRGIDSGIVDLLEDYLHFLELLIENQELAETGKIDHVIETMIHLRALTDSVSDIQQEEDSLLTIPSAHDLLHEDMFDVADDELDSGLLCIEDIDDIDDLDDDELDEFLNVEEEECNLVDDENDLHDIFLAECEEHLLVIGRAMVNLEQQVQTQSEVDGEIEQNLGTMRRAVHTLKGAAGMTGFMELAAFAHQGEDLLDAVFETKGISPEEVGVLADIVEILEVMSRQQDGVTAVRIAEIKRNIDGLLAVRSEQQEVTDLFDEEETDLLSNLYEEPDSIEDLQDLGADDGLEAESGEQLLEEIDEDGDLHDIFLAECEEHLLVIGRSLALLEQQVTVPQKLTGAVEQSLADMRRAIHTLKGAAGMTGFMELSSFSHQSEDLLDVIFDSGADVTPEDISVLADAFDIIEIMSLRPDAVDDSRVAVVNKTLQNALAAHTAKGALGVPGYEEPLAELVLEEPDSKEDGGLAVETPDVQILPGDTAGVRVRLESLDELVSLESELIVGRSTMEQGLDELHQTITELNTAKERLRRISNELETGFEVESLYGFGSEVGDSDSGRQTGKRDSEFADFDPIELDRYSQLSLIIRSLNEISVDVGSIHAAMSGVSSELRGHMARQQLLMGVMQDKLMRVRMTPMSSISRSFFRTVRGAAERLGKQVRLLVEGEDVYLDRYIWTRISDPIMHILRNAVDHGVEGVDERLEKGKPKQAMIKIAASQKGSHVVFTISDDGSGIDFSAIREKLVHDNLVEDVTTLADDDLVEYLFIPGFSTRGQVSQISGRGVGLDVVRQNIQELRGSVRVRPHADGGTEFELRIPVTLALNRAIIVKLGGEQFAIPLHDVLEIRKVPVTDITDGKKPHIKIGNKELTFHDLPSLIGLRQDSMADLLALENIIVLVVPGEGENEVVAIDAIVEQQEIIVKDLGSHLKFVFGISGATIMGDGTLVPILNIAELIVSEKNGAG